MSLECAYCDRPKGGHAPTCDRPTGNRKLRKNTALMLEREIEKKIGLYAKAKGLRYLKFTSPANRAVPDRIIIGQGVIGFLELKRKGEKPTPLQMRELLDLKQRMMNVAWVDNVTDGKVFIDLLLDKVGLPKNTVVMGRGLV